MVQGNMRVEAGHARHGGQREAGKSGQRILFVAKAGEDQVEPDDVGLAFANVLQQPCVIAEAVFLPAALNVKIRKLRFRTGIFISQDGQADKRIGLELSGYVKAVFIEHSFTRWETADKTYFHLGPENLKNRNPYHRPEG